MFRCSLPILGIVLLVATSASANVADDLHRGAEAMGRRNLAAASAAFRRAFESQGATDDERRQALDGLFLAAVETGRPADLMAYLEQRQAGAPRERRPFLDAALARCHKARDGHLHGAIAHFARRGQKADDRDARRLADSLRSLCSRVGRRGEDHARTIVGHAARLGRAREAKPGRTPRRSVGRVALPPPRRPSYAGTPTRLARPPRTRYAGRLRRLRVSPPRASRYVSTARLSIVKPPVAPRSLTRLAARFYTEAYQRARELYAKGLVENAKAEYATVIVLFPRTTYARNAARYALRIFQRQFPTGQQGEMVVAYLEWVRAAAGERGLDYAEYLALSSFTSTAPPDIIAREAGAFVRRYPTSEYLTAVRLQLAVALERGGKPDKALEALAPVAASEAPIADDAAGKTRTRALLVLAWLHIFKGDVARARPLLERVAAQPASAPHAAAARLLLEQTAAQAPDKGILPPAAPVEDSLAAQLLKAADALRLDGKHERAMDLYALYLRAGTKMDDFAVQRDRIARFKETGRLDE